MSLAQNNNLFLPYNISKIILVARVSYAALCARRHDDALENRFQPAACRFYLLLLMPGCAGVYDERRTTNRSNYSSCNQQGSNVKVRASYYAAVSILHRQAGAVYGGGVNNYSGFLLYACREQQRVVCCSLSSHITIPHGPLLLLHAAACTCWCCWLVLVLVLVFVLLLVTTLLCWY